MGCSIDKLNVENRSTTHAVRVEIDRGAEPPPKEGIVIGLRVYRCDKVSSDKADFIYMLRIDSLILKRVSTDDQGKDMIGNSIRWDRSEIEKACR